MSFLGSKSGLYTDFYELSMAQGYFYSGKKEEHAVFDYHFRNNPFDSGYTIFAGLCDLLALLEQYSFDEKSIDFLKEQGFKDEFLEYLKNFTFNGDVISFKEGEIVFPNEPVIRIEGSIIETQLVETILLNTINFQSLIATKASRIRTVAGERLFVDFGLRRAQGFGGIHASKAAVLGGADATSNVYAGYRYHLPVSGTQAHSWIQSFEDELEAFRAYAKNATGKIILLVDTYDTLNSGIPHAIEIAKELKQQGKELTAVRLDSGDLAYLSKKARKMLDKEGLNNVKIIASNQLDEYLIRSLDQQEAPIDGYGIGTQLITGLKSAALDGVYKLTELNKKPRLKLSENIEKIPLPGSKNVYRIFDAEGYFYADAVSLGDEPDHEINAIHHPNYISKGFKIGNKRTELLSNMVMQNGQRINEPDEVGKIKEYMASRLARLSEEYKRFENPHIYKVGVTKKLFDLRQSMIDELRNNSNND